jgi:hypothetical protein
MVSAFMTRAFAAIGYPNIDEDHVSPPRRIAAALTKHLRPQARRAFPPMAPVDLALYQCTSWGRR